MLGSILTLMTISKLTTLVFAAVASVVGHAQIITNYGQSYLYEDSNWNGNWTGSGQSVSNSTPLWAAQTFTATTSGPIYAYNVQLKALGSAQPTFTTSIYEWTGSGLGAHIANTDATFAFTTNDDFGAYGSNVVTNPGLGTVALNAGSLYAIVIQRTDGGVGTAQIGVTNDFEESGIAYSGGMAYRSTNGTTYTTVAGGIADFAFWVSFSPTSLSPVPEPAVNGVIIGALFVTGLIARRRHWKRADSDSSVAGAA
jgi:hypothetical protein